MATIDAIDLVAAATDRLSGTVSTLPLDEVGKPSLLPNWSRGHVLTHIARNADGLRNLILGARSGQFVPMFPSREANRASTDFGAMRPAEIIVEDVLASSRNFIVDARTTPAEVLATTALRSTAPVGSPQTPGFDVVIRRLCEVEIHHVDLNWHYGFVDSPDEVLEMIIDHYLPRLMERGMDPIHYVAVGSAKTWTHGDSNGVPTITGPAFAMASWLIGRNDGIDLAIEPNGNLPPVPPM